MSGSEILAVLLVVAVCSVLMAGYPAAATLAGVSLAFAGAAAAGGALDFALLGALPQRVYGVMTNDTLMAILLFIFMGTLLERSRVAEDLLEALARAFAGLPGGLGLAVIAVGTLLAAAKGVVGATVVTMGLIVLPAMLRHGYDKRLAAGTVAATATLAQVFPPATVLVLLADQIGHAWQAAQLAQGVFAPSPVTVTDLFAGAIVPALVLVAFYAAYVVGVALFQPWRAPRVASEAAVPLADALRAMAGPLALIGVVLGAILGGLATATESAAIGVAGAMLLAARAAGAGRAPLVTAAAAALLLALRSLADLRMPASGVPSPAMLAALALVVVIAAGLGMSLRALLRAGLLVPTMQRAAQITSMIFLVLIGATMFSLVFRGLGGDALVERLLADLPGGAAGAVVVVMLAVFLLGFVMDAFEIIFVVVPIVAPVLLKFPGVSPVWLGVLLAVNLQTSYIHPPLGPTLFYLRSVAPPEIRTADLYWGIVPFIVIQLAMLAVLWFLPGLATALPHALFGP